MNEDEATQLMQEMKTLDAYLDDLYDYENTFLTSIKECSATIDSIRSLGQKPESDTLVPIGAGAYIATKIFSDKKIALSIGAGVVLEKDFSSALNFFESRIKEMEVTLQGIAAKKQKTAIRLEQCRERVNQLMQSVGLPDSGK